MTLKSTGLATTLLGAAVGGFVAYLCFTENGRQLRRRLEPALEGLMDELGGLRSMLQKAVGVASEGWNVVNDVVAESDRRLGRHSTNPHQTYPF